MNNDIKPMTTDLIIYLHDIKLAELEKRIIYLEDILADKREQTLKSN